MKMLKVAGLMSRRIKCQQKIHAMMHQLFKMNSGAMNAMSAAVV
jgi:hypothetical protein